MKGRRGEDAPAAAVARAERTQPNGKTQGQWKRTGCKAPPYFGGCVRRAASNRLMCCTAT